MNRSIKNNNRQYYLDALRVFLTILVFAHHAAIACGSIGDWYYTSENPLSGIGKDILGLFVGINQSYFMSLFFFISALLMPASLEKKGIKVFLKDRFRRLMLPLLVYSFGLHPALLFLLGYEGYKWGFGPMWFVFTLLCFEMLYVLFAALDRKVQTISIKTIKHMHLFCLWLTTGAIAFLIRLKFPTDTSFYGLTFGYFALYIAFYILGILASKSQILENITTGKILPWFITSLVSIPLFAGAHMLYASSDNSFSGGVSSLALFYAYWESLLCIGFSGALLLVFKTYFNKKSTFTGQLSTDSYYFYIIHPLVLVPLTILFQKATFITPVVNLMLLCIVGIPLCFLVAHILTKKVA